MTSKYDDIEYGSKSLDTQIVYEIKKNKKSELSDRIIGYLFSAVLLASGSYMFYSGEDGGKGMGTVQLALGGILGYSSYKSGREEIKKKLGRGFYQ